MPLKVRALTITLMAHFIWPMMPLIWLLRRLWEHICTWTVKRMKTSERRISREHGTMSIYWERVMFQLRRPTNFSDICLITLRLLKASNCNSKKKVLWLINTDLTQFRLLGLPAPLIFLLPPPKLWLRMVLPLMVLSTTSIMLELLQNNSQLNLMINWCSIFGQPYSFIKLLIEIGLSFLMYKCG